MSKKRGAQHLKRNAPSLRQERAEVQRVRGKGRSVEAEDFYQLALTVAHDKAGVLRQKAETVKDVGSVRALAYRMLEITQRDPNCLGIAAPQMRKSVRVITVKDAAKIAHVFINPQVKPTAGAVRVAEFEGCYSLPNERAPVERWSAIVLSGLDFYGRPQKMTLTGMPARAAQHEVDHLDGVLISDHADLEPVHGDVIATGAKADG